VICASCQRVRTLAIDPEKHELRCRSCKFKGSKLQLVKKAKSLSDWEAIGFLEKLAAGQNQDATDLQDKQDKPVEPIVAIVPDHHECR
jgi:hypothetical protein